MVDTTLVQRCLTFDVGSTLINAASTLDQTLFNAGSTLVQHWINVKLVLNQCWFNDTTSKSACGIASSTLNQHWLNVNTSSNYIGPSKTFEYNKHHIRGSRQGQHLILYIDTILDYLLYYILYVTQYDIIYYIPYLGIVLENAVKIWMGIHVPTILAPC